MTIGLNDLRAIAKLKHPGIDVVKVARLRPIMTINRIEGLATTRDLVDNDLLQNTLCHLSVSIRRLSTVNQELPLRSKGLQSLGERHEETFHGEWLTPQDEMLS